MNDSFKNEIELLELLKEDKEQFKKLIESDDMSELSFNKNDMFLGFIDIYKDLSIRLTKDYTIIDIGCGYNLQSEFFRDFKEYIAVDYAINNKFHDLSFYTWKSKNTKIYNMTGQDFFNKVFNTLNLNKYYVICNYVPDNILQEYIKEHFKDNSYVYYP